MSPTGGGHTAHRLKAAGIYQQLFDALTKRCPTQIAPTAWMLEEGKSWTQAMRNEQAGILAAAFALEEQAIVEIEKALALTEK